MNIICDRTKLLEGINIVLKAVPGKSTMAILSCIVLQVKNNTINLIANDLQLGIQTTIEGNIIEESEIAVEAKMFSDIIRSFSDDEVIINLDENYVLNLKCGKANFDIVAKPTEEFPLLPTIIKDKKIEISQFSLKDIIRQTVFSISDNENTKVMTGELFEIHGSTLKVVSLDGHRISIRKIILNQNYDDVSVIIPGKTLIEISKLLNGGVDDIINIYFTDKHVLFEFDDTIVVSRLIEGEFYKIDKMLSTDYETKITVNKKVLLDSINRTTLLIRDANKKPVIIDIKDNNMGININSSYGSMNEEMDIEKEGKDILIGFNPRFIMDALRAIDEEEITMYMINPKAPCFIRDNDESYIYLILPVNFNI